MNTIVYAWGSAGDGNLALAVQTVDLAMGAPSEVAAGSAGLVNEGQAPVALVVAGLLALAAAAFATRAALARK